MGSEVSRRGLLAGGLAVAASTALGLDRDRPRKQGRDRVLRVAYLTDVHLDNQPQCAKGLQDCLKKIHSLSDAPDLIVQGGDLIMDALVRGEDSVRQQFDLAGQLFDRHCTIPAVHVIGNHDVWGWQNSSANSLKDDPRYGKGWWLEWTGYQSTYRSFDKNGWHFILLDSIYPSRRGYVARLDDTQMNWLERNLEATPSTTPVCIVSHAPILSANAMFFGPSERQGDWHVHGSLMHIDSRRLKDLFVKHPNVKACFSGHIHMAGRVDYNGVSHFGVGAVCGAWWRGKMQETPPQFGILDFYDDGRVHTTLVGC